MFQNGAVFVVWPIVFVKFWSLELLFNEGSQESPETASVTGSFNGKNWKTYQTVKIINVNLQEYLLSH